MHFDGPNYKDRRDITWAHMDLVVILLFLSLLLNIEQMELFKYRELHWSYMETLLIKYSKDNSSSRATSSFKTSQVATLINNLYMAGGRII